MISFLRLSALAGVAVLAAVSTPWLLVGVHSNPIGLLEFHPSRILELGKLEPGTHALEFRVRNVSASTIEFESVSASCGCTAAELSSNSLRPGREMTVGLELTVSPHTEKTVVVFLDLRKPAGRRHAAMLTFHSGAESRLRVVPASVSATGLAPGGEYSVLLHAYAEDQRLVDKAVQWKLGPPSTPVQLQPHGWGGDAAGRRVATATLRVGALEPGAVLRAAVLVQVGEGAKVAIPVHLVVARCVDLSSPAVLLARRSDGQPQGRIRVVARDGWKIRRITSDEDLKVDWDATSGDLRVTSASSSLDSLWSSTVRVECEASGGARAVTSVPVIQSWE